MGLGIFRLKNMKFSVQKACKKSKLLSLKPWMCVVLPVRLLRVICMLHVKQQSHRSLATTTIPPSEHDNQSADGEHQWSKNTWQRQCFCFAFFVLLVNDFTGTHRRHRQTNKLKQNAVKFLDRLIWTLYNHKHRWYFKDIWTRHVRDETNRTAVRDTFDCSYRVSSANVSNAILSENLAKAGQFP